MSEATPKLSAWAEANRLLGALSSSVGAAKPASLGRELAPADDWEERAAIMEADGGLSRAEAEVFARELAALGPAPSLAAVAALDVRLCALDARRPPAASPKARRP